MGTQAKGFHQALGAGKPKKNTQMWDPLCASGFEYPKIAQMAPKWTVLLKTHTLGAIWAPLRLKTLGLAPSGSKATFFPLGGATSR